VPADAKALGDVTIEPHVTWTESRERKSEQQYKKLSSSTQHYTAQIDI
jgi:hypothetical protein